MLRQSIPVEHAKCVAQAWKEQYKESGEYWIELVSGEAFDIIDANEDYLISWLMNYKKSTQKDKGLEIMNRAQASIFRKELKKRWVKRRI